MLARRLIIALLAVSLPGTVILSAVTLHSLGKLTRVNRHLSEALISLAATRDLQVAVMHAEIPLSDHLAARGIHNRERFEQLMATAREKTASCSSAGCHQSSRTPAHMALTLEPDVNALEAVGRQILAVPSGSTRPEIRAQMRTVEDLTRSIADKLQRMSQSLRADVATLAQDEEEVSHRAWVLIAAVAVGIFAVACGAAAFVAQRISRPLNEVVDGIRRVVAGDWAHRVPVTTGWEIGELASSFNAMVGELRQSRERLEESNRTLEDRVRQRTEELKQKDEALMRSEKLASLGLLASGVAHELNNPLTSIVMSTNLMLEDARAAAPFREDLLRIDAEASRCRRIIDDLRGFARGRDLQKIRTPVAKVVEHAVSSLGHELASRDVAVDTDLASDLPEALWDPDRMIQVLSNLLLNAAQATSKGGHVTVRARHDGQSLIIEVIDAGMGIPAAHLSRIFDPFFTTKRDGTGLGLSISHGIVAEHGGRIEVSSRAGENGDGKSTSGTTMTIVLPLDKAERPA